MYYFITCITKYVAMHNNIYKISQIVSKILKIKHAQFKFLF